MTSPLVPLAMKCFMTSSPFAYCCCTTPCSRSSAGSRDFQPWYHCSTSPKSHSGARSHSRSTACQCGKKATSNTDARLESGMMSCHTRRSSMGCKSCPSGFMGISATAVSSFRSTFSMRGSQFAVSKQSFHGLTILCAKWSEGLQRSSIEESLKRIGAHRQFKPAPSSGNHGWIHKCTDSFSVRGSQASTSARSRGNTSSSPMAMAVSFGNALPASSSSRRHGSTLRTDQPARAARSLGTSTSSAISEKDLLSSRSVSFRHGASRPRPFFGASSGFQSASSLFAIGTARPRETSSSRRARNTLGRSARNRQKVSPSSRRPRVAVSCRSRRPSISLTVTRHCSTSLSLRPLAASKRFFSLATASNLSS
mmetsp:Transcript_88610/g.228528  ORF Transcript_88610/g.228528 Transcript_88610/m.228528 type:complete len:367 (-) Transcript_88610:780-1880(-)